MLADPAAHRPAARIGCLRIEEVEARVFLPRILRLRTTSLGRRISLTPDVYAWADPLDLAASHWCVFNDADLVAAARLSFCAGAMHGSQRTHDAPPPILVMSHCVVDPRSRDCCFDEMLDAARIDRARHLGCPTLVAQPESRRRIRTLTALGFTTLERAGISHVSSGLAFILDLSGKDERAPAIARRPPTG